MEKSKKRAALYQRADQLCRDVKLALNFSKSSAKIETDMDQKA